MSQTPRTAGTEQERPVACGPDDGGNGRHFHGPTPREVYEQMGQLVAELKESATCFAMAKADRLKLSLRQLGVYAALGVMGLVALWAAIATGVVLTLLGAAYGFAALFGGRLWAGTLLAGILTLALLALGTWAGIAIMTRSSRTKTVEKYEQRQHWERGRFGRAVEDTAARAD